MADQLVEYVQEQLAADQAPIDEIDSLVGRVVSVFLKSFDDGSGTWRYQVITGRDVKYEEEDATASADAMVGEQKRGYSFSTTAMIAYALELVSGGIERSPLAPAVNRYRPADPKSAKKQREDVESVVAQAVSAIAAASEKLKDPGTYSDDLRSRLPSPEAKDPPLTSSVTFGWDDPFTLNWLFEVLAARNEHPEFRKAVIGRARWLIGKVLVSPYTRRSGAAPQPVRILQVRTREDVEHVFPLLRVLQLRESISRRSAGSNAPGNVGSARNYLFSVIHRQLSESQLADGDFDPAELVFALEGWLLTSDSDEPDLRVVDRVFEVMTQTQERVPYWHPFKPFKATAQGLVLLPQSVEIANSLLRICSHPALRTRRYFGQHAALLERYTDWLIRRTFYGTFTVKGKRHDLIGWESEFTHRLDRIHLWETSQVLIYLQHYAAMRREHIAQRLLDLAGFRAATVPANEKDPDPKKQWKTFKTGEPLTGAVGVGSPYLVYDAIERDFIRPRDDNRLDDALYSMILYGPPGTGKSRIAEEMAYRLELPLLRVTPSDFVASGSEEVEARAKAIFAVLLGQTNLVVLFDEIDSLLLDRNSQLYRDQGDIFRMLTPGMLTKLNDLARAESVVFVVATNYYERIDAAIKRPGRIDERYLVLPPGKRRREAFLREKDQLGDALWSSLPDAGESLLSESARFTYSELRQIVKRVERKSPGATGKALQAALEQALRDAPPMARADLYDSRLKKRRGGTQAGAIERPEEEYALLAFLDLDSGQQLSSTVRDALVDLDLDEVKDAAVRERIDAAKTPAEAGEE